MGLHSIDLVPGTLDMLILKTLSLQPMHGLGISRRMEQVTGGTLMVKPGSLFPSLHRMEQEGWIAGSWGKSDNNRRAKFYELTTAGRRRFGDEERTWAHALRAITQILEAT